MATREQLIEDFADHKLATGEKFERLINSMKTGQEPVTAPAASGTSLSFIDSISQDADGKITATKKTLDLANAHELNPFKGWYKTGDTLPTDGFDGAYLYFTDTSELTGQTTIYRWNGTTYADTGTVVDTSNVQTFGSGQAVNAVKIKNENGEEVSGSADVLSAEAGASLKGEITVIGLDVNGGSEADVVDIKDTLTDTEGEYGSYLENAAIADTGQTSGSTGFRRFNVYVTEGDIINAVGLGVPNTGLNNRLYYALYSSHSVSSDSYISDSGSKTENYITDLVIPEGVQMVAISTQISNLENVEITLTRQHQVDGLKQRVQRLEEGGDEYIQERTEEKTVTVNYEWLVANSTRYDGSIASGGTSVDPTNPGYECMAWYADSDGTIYVNTVGTSTTLFRVLIASGEPTSYVKKQYGGSGNHPLPDSSSPFTFEKGDLIIVNYTDNKTDFQLTMNTTETAPWLDESVKIPYLEELKEEGGGIATKEDLADLGVNYFELVKTSATEFTLTLNLNGGKKVKHTFRHVILTKDFGSGGVSDVRTTCDIWTSPWTDINGIRCIQGNLNFIYVMGWQYDNIPKTAEDAFKVNAGDSIIISVPTPPATQYTDFVIKYNSTNITTSWLENNATKYIGKADRNGYNSADTGYNTYIFTAPNDGDIYVPTKGYTIQVINNKTRYLMHLLIGTGGVNDYQLNYWGETPWPEEEGHIGPEHGCEIMDYTYFYCDGTLVDFSNMSIGDKLMCRNFRIVERSKCYAGKQENGGYTQPILDNGNFILAHVHYLDAEFTNDGRIRWDNKLTVKRDYTSYHQAYGGMLRVYYPYIDEISINNNEDTTNFVSSDGTFTLAHNSTINLNNSSQWGDTIIVRGHVGENDGFVVKQTMVQADNARRKRSNCYFQYYNDSYKVYLMPVVGGYDGRGAVLNTPFDVFNDGDVIEVYCEREIIY